MGFVVLTVLETVVLRTRHLEWLKAFVHLQNLTCCIAPAPVPVLSLQPTVQATKLLRLFCWCHLLFSIKSCLIWSKWSCGCHESWASSHPPAVLLRNRTSPETGSQLDCQGVWGGFCAGDTKPDLSFEVTQRPLPNFSSNCEVYLFLLRGRGGVLYFSGPNFKLNCVFLNKEEQQPRPVSSTFLTSHFLPQ